MFESQLGETGSTIVQFALALVAVIALIFLVAWLAKRLSGGRFGHVHGDEASMQVLDTLHIDTKRKLVLVRQGKLEHLLLIGGGSDEVVERSMIGGIPLAARVQATKQQDKQSEEEPLPRPADRYRPSSRFSRSLQRKKDEESASEADTASAIPKPAEKSPADVGAANRAGGVRKTTALPPAEKGKAARLPLMSGESDAPAKVEDKSIADPTFPSAAKAEPSLSGEPDALHKSLDQALSESLMDNDPPFESSAPVVRPPEPAAPVSADSKPSPAGKMDDLDLERELEAALELDAFEAEPARTPPPVDLPPLPDPPSLDGVETKDITTKRQSPEEPAQKANDEEAITPAPVETKQRNSGPTSQKDDTPFPTERSEAKPEQSTTEDPMEPASVMEPAERGRTAENKPDDESSSPKDASTNPSGRAAPPVSLPIPSRGPAASTTTLTKPDTAETAAVVREAKPDDALDISAMLHPGMAKAETATDPSKAEPDTEPSSDDLDNEMRRLLGEIAGEPDKK